MKDYWKNTRDSILERVGSMQQLAPVRRVAFLEGRSKSVEAIEVDTGAGLSFTVLVDRALDLGDARWCGRSLSWQSSAGIVAPDYYEREGTGWLRGFGGGMLTTCGLRNVGPPSKEDGEAFGLHGEISSTPAASVSSRTFWRDHRYCIEIQGEVRESYPFGPNLSLRRIWRTEFGADWLELEDVVTNEGFRPELHMQLYHWNFGFPLINETTKLSLTTDSMAGRDETANAGLSRWSVFEPPSDDFIGSRCSSIPIPRSHRKRHAYESPRIRKPQRSLWSFVIQASNCRTSLNGNVAGRERMSLASNRATAGRKEELSIAIGMGVSCLRGNLPISPCACAFWGLPARIFIPKVKRLS